MKTIITFKNLVFILFFFFCCTTYAQQHFCHFDSLMLADTAAYNSYYAHQKSIRQNKPTDFKRNTFSSSKRSSHKTANYIIPIVVHVIHNNKAYGQQNNITNYQIQQQIDSLNHAMKAANNGIQFCFATKKPDGSPFSGILRHNSTILPYVGTNGVFFNLGN